MTHWRKPQTFATFKSVLTVWLTQAILPAKICTAMLFMDMQVNDDHTTQQTMFPRLQSQLLQTSLAQGFAPQWLQGKVLAKINLLFSHACKRYRLVQLVYGRVRVCVKLQCRGPGDHCVMASAHYFHLCCAAGGFLWPMLIFLWQSRFHCQGTESHVREVLPSQGTCFSSFVCHQSVVPLTLKKLLY